MATEPNFIDRDVNKIIEEMVTYHENRRGIKLQPGSPERELINDFAYREAQLRSQVQSAGVQMLIRFSSAPILDYLVELLGVTRLSPAAAVCTIQLNFVATHAALTIPEGMRIQSQDGKTVFELTESVEVDADALTATVPAQCQTTGVIGNEYPAGQISIILDPQPFLSTAANTDVTAAGSDTETDEQLRERAILAPSTFSVAGPTDAYKYWAKTASPSIIDVEVTNPVPGEVHVFPLVAGTSATPAPILAAVEDILDDEKRRPLCDTVIVTSPTAVNYTLDVELTLFPDVIPADAEAEVNTILEEFTRTISKKLGRDVTKAKLTALCMLENKVYNVAFPGFVDVTVNPTEYGFCTDISINTIGENE
jgi:phage-related baseplate assembly protein